MFYAVLTPLLAALYTTTAPLREELAAARRIISGTNEQLKSKNLALTKLENALRTLLAKDPRALGFGRWLEGLVLLAIGTAEFWTNRVCAQGLFLDQTATNFIAGAFTLVAGLVAWGLAREDQLQRQTAAKGEVGTSQWRLYGLLAVLAAYGIGTFFPRRDYFQVNNQIAKSLLGSASMTSAVVVAAVLTILSVALVLLAAYVLSHADGKVAACKRGIRTLERQISTLSASNRNAKDREDSTLQGIDSEVKQAHFAAMGLLEEANKVPESKKSREAFSDEVYSILWDAATTVGPTSRTRATPDAPPEKLESPDESSKPEDRVPLQSRNHRGDEDEIAALGLS
ncbi:MAG TPA: hypothetical protein VKR23_15395 [Gaiellaceae bacterium]|nr:hypothetical protein [Gaiellaceae bacterium]